MDYTAVYTRVCPDCEEELPATEDHFHYSASNFLNLSWICKDCANRRNRIYARRYKGKPARRYREKYPLKRAAHDALRTARATGKIPDISTQACEDCGETAEDYHHEDYKKPLDVIPLCRKCHGLRHRN